VELYLKNETLSYALGLLSVEHRVPIGIVNSLEDTGQAKLNLEFDDGTVKEILNTITKQEPLYRWEFVDGVVNFVPVEQKDPFFESLLNTRVQNFNPGKWTIIYQVRDAIGDIPEVRRLLGLNHKTLFKYGDYAYYPSIYTKRDVDLSASNTTVRGVLNRIIKDSEHKSWCIRWRPGDKDAFMIRF